MQKTRFGKLPTGQAIDVFTLVNQHGMQAQVMTYGAALISLKTADNMGQITEITLGFDSLPDYLRHPMFGAVAGRYANRIANGTFNLENRTISLAKNNGSHHLHGGIIGFDKKVWSAEPQVTAEGQAVTLHYTSKDGEEGYPGNLRVSVTYTVTQNNSLKIKYAAETDKPTVLNLTNHAYFNLKDGGRSSILDHVIKINASNYTPSDNTLIPTGEIASVEASVFDLRKPSAIGEAMKQDEAQLLNARGFDHNFIIVGGNGLKYVATVFEPTTGRVMNVASTEPGVQFYTGNHLNNLRGRAGAVYQQHHGFCLETQHFPDSPNHPDFPSTVLRPGEKYESTTVFLFSVSGVKFE
ncbi:MAG: galactose mutarotase [Calditrichaeota bacterium]|nr:MAG: galactose mutarotase [Calditrichota bacterium]